MSQQLFKPYTKYTLDEITTLANYIPTYALSRRVIMVVTDGTQYDFLLYLFASGDAWILVAVDGELTTIVNSLDQPARRYYCSCCGDFQPAEESGPDLVCTKCRLVLITFKEVDE